MNKIAITRIARMMIDVDPNFRRPHSLKGGPQSILNRGVECDGNIDIFSGGGWLGHQI